MPRFINTHIPLLTFLPKLSLCMCRKKPRIFVEIPKELKYLWSGAVILFAEAWPHFIPVIVMSIAQKVSALALEGDDTLQSKYAQSLYTAWYKYTLDQWSDVLCADQSSFLATAECVMTSCYPLDSPWAEEIIQKTAELAPPPLSTRLVELSIASVNK